MLEDVPPYEEIASRLMQGKVIVFLGPDINLANRPSGVRWERGSDFPPTDIELARFLADDQRIAIHISHALNLVEVASEIEWRNSRHTLSERLNDAFSGSYHSHGLFAFLASIPIPLIIVTTNYDDLLEQSFVRANQPFEMLAPVFPAQQREEPRIWWGHNTDRLRLMHLNELSEGNKIDPSRTTIILKIRGTVVIRHDGKWLMPEEDSYLITEDDYLNLFTRLTTQEALIERLRLGFSDYSFLFLGFGMAAWNMRMLFRSILRLWRSDLYRRKLWIFESRAADYGGKLWSDEKVDIYDGNLSQMGESLTDVGTKLVDDAVEKTIRNIKTKTLAAPTVFISYAREDARPARNVYKTLKRAGFNPWMDKEEILAGEDWESKIKTNLKNADFLIICLSTGSLMKWGYFQKEIRMALERTRESPLDSVFLIPIRFDNCALPDELARYQFVDWSQAEGSRKVVRAIALGWLRRKNVSRATLNRM